MILCRTLNKELMIQSFGWHMQAFSDVPNLSFIYPGLSQVFENLVGVWGENIKALKVFENRPELVPEFICFVQQ